MSDDSERWSDEELARELEATADLLEVVASVTGTEGLSGEGIDCLHAAARRLRGGGEVERGVMDLAAWVECRCGYAISAHINGTISDSECRGDGAVRAFRNALDRERTGGEEGGW